MDYQNSDNGIKEEKVEKPLTTLYKTTSVLSLIFSIIWIVLFVIGAIIAFLGIFALSRSFFIFAEVLFCFALAFCVFGLVLGIFTIIKYKKEKSKGTNRRGNLIRAIIGTAISSYQIIVFLICLIQAIIK